MVIVVTIPTGIVHIRETKGNVKEAPEHTVDDKGNISDVSHRMSMLENNASGLLLYPVMIISVSPGFSSLSIS